MKDFIRSTLQEINIYIVLNNTIYLQNITQNLYPVRVKYLRIGIMFDFLRSMSHSYLYNDI